MGSFSACVFIVLSFKAVTELCGYSRRGEAVSGSHMTSRNVCPGSNSAPSHHDLFYNI